ncbi:MAG: hypothetical protein ABL901_19090 [Hyphomicrobiaceae bacterium]
MTGQDVSSQQRFQYRAPLRSLFLNAPGIASYALFQMAWLTPVVVVLGLIGQGYNPDHVNWLIAVPFEWVGAHLLWKISDALFFRANRAEARADPRGFFLLLRPFKQTEATAVPGVPETLDLVGSILRGTHPIIWQYGVHLAPFGRLVTVGKVRLPKPVLSNDTVCVRAKDENWFEIVRALAQQCRAIILLFDEGRGILDEVKHLSASGLTSKTIIRVAPIQPLAADPEASQRRWIEAKGLLEQAGFIPPMATPEGFLYIPRPDFSVLHSVPLSQGTESALQELLTLMPAADSGCSLADAMGLIDEFERRTFGTGGK